MLEALQNLDFTQRSNMSLIIVLANSSSCITTLTVKLTPSRKLCCVIFFSATALFVSFSTAFVTTLSHHQRYNFSVTRALTHPKVPSPSLVPILYLIKVDDPPKFLPNAFNSSSAVHNLNLKTTDSVSCLISPSSRFGDGGRVAI